MVCSVTKRGALALLPTKMSNSVTDCLIMGFELFTPKLHVVTIIISKTWLELIGVLTSGGLNWETFRKQVDDPEISIRYHVLNRHSVRDYVYAFKRNNKQLGPDRNPLLLLSRIALRMALFNTLTVRYAWLPMAYAAEHSPMFAKLMHRQLYRGIISYHFFKGASDAEMVFSRTEGYDKHAPKC
jgi:hypothetical protein